MYFEKHAQKLKYKYGKTYKKFFCCVGKFGGLIDIQIYLIYTYNNYVRLDTISVEMLTVNIRKGGGGRKTQ